MGKEKTDKLEKEYQEAYDAWDEASENVKRMEQYKIVKKYLEAIKTRDKLDRKEEELYKKRLLRKYASCNPHVLVECYTDVIYDYEGRSYHYFGCVDCGYNEYAVEIGSVRNREERTMAELAEEHHVYKIDGIRTGVNCDLDKGKAVYRALKESNPDLSKEELAGVFTATMKGKKLINKL